MKSTKTNCIGICTLEGDTCIGCERSITEIKAEGVLKRTERMELLNKLSQSKCPECKNTNNCAIEGNKSSSSCWCFGIQAKENIEESESCLCKSCLKGK